MRLLKRHLGKAAQLAAVQLVEALAAQDLACLKDRGEVAISHDHYFHSVLGLLDVQTGSYQAPLDAYAACRRARPAADA